MSAIIDIIDEKAAVKATAPPPNSATDSVSKVLAHIETDSARVTPTDAVLVAASSAIISCDNSPPPNAAAVVNVKEIAQLKVDSKPVPDTLEKPSSEVVEKVATEDAAAINPIAEDNMSAMEKITPAKNDIEESAKLSTDDNKKLTAPAMDTTIAAATDAPACSAVAEPVEKKAPVAEEVASPSPAPFIAPVEETADIVDTETTPRSDDTETVDASDVGSPSPAPARQRTITTLVSSTLPPMTPQRGRINMNLGLHNQTPMRSPRSSGTPRTPSTPASPHIELSAKQVRELRRLCRKTANRAEYEGRLVQLRQIASILAMGGPSLVHFAPSYLAAHSAMQAWLDACRAGGADWRDERPLSIAAVDELREWDRLLKAWAKRRFPTLADCAEGCAPPTTPRTKRLDIMAVASPMSVATPSPARALVAAQSASSPAGLSSPGSTTPGRRRVSRMSISHDGDTINVSIVRTPEKAMPTEVDKSPWRPSPRRDQENIHPDGEARDWRSLRKGVNEGGASTALKARNW